MAVVLLVLSYLALFFSISISGGLRLKLKDSLVRSLLVFCLLLLSITEITSLFEVLTYQAVLVCWMMVLMGNAAYMYVNRYKLLLTFGRLSSKLKVQFSAGKNSTNLFFVCTITLVLLIFIQGLVYPPNNWDSMSYHMSRITNWLAHQSVSYYPTHIIRQLYQPPFSEYVIMHINLLTGHDYFSNGVQLFFLLFSCVSIVSIVELLGLNYRYQLLAILIALTIPEVVLQASSTQNDIVVSFFILSSIYFAVQSVKTKGVAPYLFLGLSIGLAVLTKAVAIIYLFPVLVLWGVVVVRNLIRSRDFTCVGYSFILLLATLVITSGYFLRNYQYNHTLLGADARESKRYSNEYKTPASITSALLKNAGLHIGPAPLNEYADKIIFRLHDLAGLDIDRPGSNFGNTRYRGGPDVPTHEDTASNTLHFLLLIWSIFIVGIHAFKTGNYTGKGSLYLFVLLFQVLLFCMLLKWQPWHTRLHTPFFLLSVPFICYAFSVVSRFRRVLWIIVPLLSISAYLIVMYNSSRPFISNSRSAVTITDSRYKKYFANRIEAYEEYKAIHEKIRFLGVKKAGLMLSGDHWEYPLFNDVYRREIIPFHINVTNESKKLVVSIPNPDCIISTTVKEPFIDYNGIRFYNTAGNNKIIWLFEK